MAIGSFAVGGRAIGTIAMAGGGALGEHVVSATHTDPEAEALFEEHGLGVLCGPPPTRRR